MMKKSFLSLILSVTAISGMAEESSAIVITMNDDSRFSIALSQLQSIKFSGDNMIVTKKDQSKQSVAIDNVAVITFQDILTAVKSIAGEETDSTVTVTTLAGNIIFQGKAEGYSPEQNLPEGIYIVTSAGRSHKICIKR